MREHYVMSPPDILTDFVSPSLPLPGNVVEETISAGEAIIKFETESATFAAVSGQESGANCKESKESAMSETKSRKNG